MVKSAKTNVIASETIAGAGCSPSRANVRFLPVADVTASAFTVVTSGLGRGAVPLQSGVPITVALRELAMDCAGRRVRRSFRECSSFAAILTKYAEIASDAAVVGVMLGLSLLSPDRHFAL